MYPTYVDKQCYNCGNTIILKKITMFEEIICEMEFGGAPEVTCNFCGCVVGIIRPIKKDEDDNKNFLPLFSV